MDNKKDYSLLLIPLFFIFSIGLVYIGSNGFKDKIESKKIDEVDKTTDDNIIDLDDSVKTPQYDKDKVDVTLKNNAPKEEQQKYTKVLIKYDDQKSYEKSNNIGCLQIFKFENEKSTFEIMDIYDNSVTGVYSYEIKLGLDIYFYIIMHEYNKNQYYLYNEQMDEYSYITIEDMPINIIDFSLKNNVVGDYS